MKPLALLFYILFLALVPAFSVDFYVSTAGSDSNPGTQAQPFATIQHAIDATQEEWESVIHLDGSIWAESPTVFLKKITIIGDYNGPNGPGGQTTSRINGTMTFDGRLSFGVYFDILQSVTAQNVIALLSTDIMGNPGIWCYILNCTVSNPSGDGVSCQTIMVPGGAWHDVQIKDCTIHDCSGNGITSNYDGSHNVIVDSCLINNSTGSGIKITKGIKSISNCTISGNQQDGIYFSFCDTDVYNNTIQNNQSYGVYFNGSACSPDVGGGAQSSLGNNTISGNSTYEAYNASPNNIYAKYNHWDALSESEMAGGYYNTVNVTRIWDHWEDSSKGYVMWSDPYPSKVNAPSLGILKAAFYTSSNTVGRVKAR